MRASEYITIGIIMATIKDLEPRLRKLLPMLGSDNPGEASNAARLITSIMRSSKLDWHDVVKKLFEETPKAKQNTNQNSNSYNPYGYQQQQKQENPYYQYQNSYNSYKEYKEYHDEEGENWYWDKKDTGNYSGVIFGRHCTVYQSKQVPGMWDAVINEFGGQKIWLKGYKTAKAAKDFIRFKLDPDAKDDW